MFCFCRKLESADEGVPKKIRFTSGFKTRHLEKKDLALNESWNKFLEYQLSAPLT